MKSIKGTVEYKVIHIAVAIVIVVSYMFLIQDVKTTTKASEGRVVPMSALSSEAYLMMFSSTEDLLSYEPEDSINGILPALMQDAQINTPEYTGENFCREGYFTRKDNSIIASVYCGDDLTYAESAAASVYSYMIDFDDIISCDDFGNYTVEIPLNDVLYRYLDLDDESAHTIEETINAFLL